MLKDKTNDMSVPNSRGMKRRASDVDTSAARAPKAAKLDTCGKQTAPRPCPAGDCVQVCVRVRPPNDRERANPQYESCVEVIGTRKVQLHAAKTTGSGSRFEFDNAFSEATTQEDVFEVVGKTVVDHCFSGINTTIFAYGQTGAGKTHTMLGDLSPSSEQRGLAPRVFEYLFNKISERENQKGTSIVKYSCHCSFLEVYNETITDLLVPSSKSLQVKVDMKKGCSVEGLTEESVVNWEEAVKLLVKGAANRKVGKTNMNKDSSRSHSVFTFNMQCTSARSEDGLTNVVFSRLHLVDLAGSERVDKSGATGSQFTEATNINLSLTTLGRVISQLVEAQLATRRKDKQLPHIPYRDSKLTYLLQDSLGGNARTWIIANLSPSSCNAEETLSTLRFADRAKRIRNKAVVNRDTQGDAAMLQKEITRLQQEVENLRQNAGKAVAQDNVALRADLQAQQKVNEELQLQLSVEHAEVERCKRERARAEDQMQQLQTTQGAVACALDTALLALVAHERCQIAAVEANTTLQDVEEKKWTQEIASVRAELQQTRSELDTMTAARLWVEGQLAGQLQDAAEEKAKWQEEKASYEHQIMQLQSMMVPQLRELNEQRERIEQLQEALEHGKRLEVKHEHQKQQALDCQQEAAAAHLAECDELREEVGALRTRLECTEKTASVKEEQLNAQLQQVLAELAAAQQLLETEIQASGSANKKVLDTEAQVEEMKRQYTLLQAELAKQNGLISTLHTAVSQSDAKRQKADARADSLLLQLDDVKKRHAELQGQASQQEDLQAQLAEVSSHLASTQEQLTTKQNALDSSDDQVKALQAELEQLRQQMQPTSQRSRPSSGLSGEAPTACRSSRDELDSLTEEDSCALEEEEMVDAEVIHLAAIAGNLDDIRKQLCMGKDINHRNAGGLTPVHCAAGYTRGSDVKKATLEFLHRKGANMKATTMKTGMNALQLAVLSGDDTTITKWLLQHCDVDAQCAEGKTALHYACERGRIEQVKMLLENKADINKKSNKGGTPLHSAVASFWDISYRIVKELLKAGASLQEVDQAGNNPIHIAAARGRIQVAEMMAGHCKQQFGGKAASSYHQVDPRSVPNHAGQTPYNAINTEGMDVGKRKRWMNALFDGGN